MRHSICPSSQTKGMQNHPSLDCCLLQYIWWTLEGGNTLKGLLRSQRCEGQGFWANCSSSSPSFLLHHLLLFLSFLVIFIFFLSSHRSLKPGLSISCEFMIHVEETLLSSRNHKISSIIISKYQQLWIVFFCCALVQVKRLNYCDIWNSCGLTAGRLFDTPAL